MPADEALELTHEFFLARFAKHDIKNLDPGKGLFRNWLRSTAANFLRNARRSSQREREKLSSADLTACEELGPRTSLDPWLLLERDLALAILEGAVTKLEQEREARGAKGRNWLFFGDQKRITDFLYEDQIVDWQRRGILDRLDLAFSRDQAEKIYVQTRMAENAAELWTWLEEGAHFYVCGDAQRMAKDVEDTLLRIAVEHGGKSAGEAKAWLDGLAKAGRYQRDVY